MYILYIINICICSSLCSGADRRHEHVVGVNQKGHWILLPENKLDIFITNYPHVVTPMRFYSHFFPEIYIRKDQQIEIKPIQVTG